MGKASVFEKVPHDIKLFLIRAIIVFIAWQALYRFVLAPARVPDRALTNLTCGATAIALSIFYHNVSAVYTPAKEIKNAYIFKDGRRVIAIADPCNALDLYVLYAAFLFCFPGTARRRLLFLVTGIPAIFIANIIRCAILTWIALGHKDWFNISHHFIFTTLMYLFIFYCWVLYTKKASYAG
jgi:exosortase/archaeosortase family protein